VAVIADERDQEALLAELRLHLVILPIWIAEREMRRFPSKVANWCIKQHGNILLFPSV